MLNFSYLWYLDIRLHLISNTYFSAPIFTLKINLSFTNRTTFPPIGGRQPPFIHPIRGNYPDACIVKQPLIGGKGRKCPIDIGSEFYKQKFCTQAKIV